MLSRLNGLVFESTPANRFITLFDLNCSLFTARELELEPGDTMVLYTDGITEAMNPAGEEFGAARLAQFISEGRTLSVRALWDTLVRAVDDFTAGARSMTTSPWWSYGPRKIHITRRNSLFLA